MKVNQNYLQQASKSAAKNKSERSQESGRTPNTNDSDLQDRFRKTSDPSLKEDSKFVSFLQSAPKTEKPKEKNEDSGNNQRNDSKKTAKSSETKETKEVKESDSEDDSVDNSTGEGKTEKFEESGGNAGGQFGGQSSFGDRGNVNLPNINEAFAARSILHIADLERMVSSIRTQTALGGKREIVLELRRSVLEGLQVKITTDPSAKVYVEFFAASDKVRAEIEKHSPELAQILRGRGINLESLKTTVKSDTRNQDSANREKDFSQEKIERIIESGNLESEGNTFTDNDLEPNNVYSA